MGNTCDRRRPATSEGVVEAQNLKETGNKYFEANDFPKAAALYTAAIELQPRNTVLLVNRANAYRKQQLWEQSQEDCEAAIKLEPTNPKAVYGLVLALKSQNKLEKAINVCNQAIKLEPTNLKAVYGLVLELKSQNKLDKANQVCNQGLQLSDGNNVLRDLKTNLDIMVGGQQETPPDVKAQVAQGEVPSGNKKDDSSGHFMRKDIQAEDEMEIAKEGRRETDMQIAHFRKLLGPALTDRHAFAKGMESCGLTELESAQLFDAVTGDADRDVVQAALLPLSVKVVFDNQKSSDPYKGLSKDSAQQAIRERMQNPTETDAAYKAFLQALCAWGCLGDLPLDDSGFLSVNVPFCGDFFEAPMLLPWLFQNLGLTGLTVVASDLTEHYAWARLQEWVKRSSLPSTVNLKFEKLDLTTANLPAAGLVLAVHPGPDICRGSWGSWAAIIGTSLRSLVPGGRCIIASFYYHEVEGVKQICEDQGAHVKVKRNPYYSGLPWKGVCPTPLKYIVIVDA